MPLTPEALQRLLIAELNGPMCRCGVPKKPGQTFCRKCYYALEPVKQKNLYRRVGNGYEAAYMAALTSLAALGRISELPEWIDA